ncbi:hypothetical protein [Pseudomonas qingdaonensis]|uniref:hypothetical protein n=1 Tax=Pseudomonas qingdaonensis TaxID=2056231 RepID=UPI002E18CD9F|nr:hypothetical protein [Pseudomonas qingdaonensis]
MFETHARAVRGSPFDSDKGLLALDFVSQRFHAEWFYINQGIELAPGETSSRMLLIDDPHELKALLSSRTTGAWIQEIYLVTPGDVNKTGSWAIDLLIEISEISSGSNVSSSDFIYRTDSRDGKCFSKKTDGIWENLPSKTIYRRNLQDLSPGEPSIGAIL